MLRKIKRNVLKFLKKELFIPYKGFKKHDIIVIDDIFPNPLSGFRLEEFTQILLHFKKSKIVATGKSYSYINSNINQFSSDITEFKNKHKQQKNKLYKSNNFVNINTKIFYCIFLNNIYHNLSWLEKYKIPFVFTLYPGGGFQIDNEECNFKLKKVLQSPQFRMVIITQKFTADYLIKKDFCATDKIKFIFGGVVPQISLEKSLANKKTYLKNKQTFDIAFCAAKYMPKGLDKGYDVFIKLAHLLNQKFDYIRFHIIGGFNENEIDVSSLKNNIKFYGYQNFENLTAIFQEIDIIISPNKPFYLSKGSFDGFPLGTVVEAVLNGVVAMVTDKLNQNEVFVNQKEIVIIESDAIKIEKEIINLINNPEKMYSIATNGQKKFNEIYSNKLQMNARIELFNNELKKVK